MILAQRARLLGRSIAHWRPWRRTSGVAGAEGDGVRGGTYEVEGGDFTSDGAGDPVTGPAEPSETAAPGSAGTAGPARAAGVAGSTSSNATSTVGTGSTPTSSTGAGTGAPTSGTGRAWRSGTTLATWAAWALREVKRGGSVVARPFAVALFQGDADPRFAAPRLTFRVPSWLGALIPVRSYSLVQAADFLLAATLYGLMISMGADWNERAALAHAANPLVHGPIPMIFLYLAALGISLPIVLRDWWPLAAWRVAAVLLPVVVWMTVSIGDGEPPYPIPAIIMYLLVLYSVAVRCDRQTTWGVWMMTVLALWIIHPNSMFLSTVIASVAVLFGYNVRARRTATARLVKEEQRTRQAEGAQAVLEERARIARELHDVVAHHMSVIAIQAEAVPLKAAGDVRQLEAGLAEIRGLSLEAIAELRQVLGVLRDPQGRTDTAPQPGLDRIDELIANARAAGLAVLVKRSGPLGDLSQAVELSAYRIVQESLSNAMRHAPGTTVAVEITRRADELRLRIANGPATTSATAAGEAAQDIPDPALDVISGKAGREGGQGLVGMRERVALLGGRFDAGPVEGGGFEVRAMLPIAEREQA